MSDDNLPEPDPRVTFADERTFLAWIRTALAIIGGGVAIAGLVRGAIGLVAGLPLIVFGAFLAVGSYLRWQQNENAIRRGEPLPSSQLPQALAFGVVTAAGLAVVVAIIRWH